MFGTITGGIRTIAVLVVAMAGFPALVHANTLNDVWIDSTGLVRQGGVGDQERGTKAAGITTPAFSISDVSLIDPNVRKVAKDLADILGENSTITAKCSGGKGSFKAIKAPTVAIPTAGKTSANLSHVVMSGGVDFDLVFDRKKGYTIYSKGVAKSPILLEVNNKSIVAEGIMQNFKQEKFLNKYTRYLRQFEYTFPQIYAPDLFTKTGTNVPSGYAFLGYRTLRPQNSPSGMTLMQLFNSSASTEPDISEMVTRNDCKRYEIYRKPAAPGCFICQDDFRKTNTAVNTSCPVPTGEVDLNQATLRIGALMNETYSASMGSNYYSRVSGMLYTWYMGEVDLEYSYDSVLTSVDKVGLVLTHEKDQNGVYKNTVKVKMTLLGQTQGGSLIPIHPIAHKVFSKGTGYFYKADGVIKSVAVKPSPSEYPVNTYSSDSTVTCTFKQ